MPKIERVERRKYIRLNSVFPVEIYLRNNRDEKPARLIQAFTHDISLGGLCLAVNDPDPSLLAAAASAGSIPIDIAINIPLRNRPVEARVKIAWHEIKQLIHHRRLLLGVAYLDIAFNDRQRIFVAAQRMKWLPRIGLASVILLLCLLAASDYNSSRLKVRNKELVEQFYKVQKEVELYRRSETRLEEKYDAIKNRIKDGEKTADSLRARLALLKTEDPKALTNERSRLDTELAAVLSLNEMLESQLEGVAQRKSEASKLLDDVKSQRLRLEKATTENMYQWLKTHRNRFTGLVISFEGDPAITDWAFTYDQSVVSQAFLIAGDDQMAGQVLSFFRDKASRRDGGFVNAYNAMTGAASENAVHLGPNIWIAIAAVHYADRARDRSYIDMAEKIAAWVISMKDGEGGLRGGPDVKWYSTEHNLDAYALFNMLYSVTGNDRYRKEMLSTLKWIKDNTYSKSEGRMNRGKGDSTIATDTLAWAIAAIGPATLAKEGMDPDAIMKFAEEHCLVSTAFTRPDGETLTVKGFDFAKARNIGRNGVISTEWTAQMVISYKMMADYYKGLKDSAKADEYSDKAAFYLGELDKMVISSPSPSGQGAGCLPYASQPSADTGHGWRTPAGVQTGSVSGTAYTIFAKKGYNPLSLD